MDINLDAFRLFGEALAVGLLIGVERYKGRRPDERQPAGLRTFAIIALLGAACALVQDPLATAVTFGGLFVLVAIAYFRQSEESIGLTTELTALMTFWLGYLVKDHETLVVSATITLVILLAAKRALHDFVKQQISEVELHDTLKFLAVVFVVYPLLPDRDLGPLGFLNPKQVWVLVILVSTISFSGYVLIRILGSRRGLQVSALVGGIVSTTATTMSLAQQSRTAPEFSRLCGVTAVMANSVQFPRLLLILWVVQENLAITLLLPLAVMFGVGMAGSGVLTLRTRNRRRQLPVELLLKNPYSFSLALKFGLFFVGVFLLIKVASWWGGESGVYLASAIGGLTSASAITLSVSSLLNSGSITSAVAATAIFVGLASNALLKWFMARLNGTPELAFWLGGGLASMLAAGTVTLLASS